VIFYPRYIADLQKKTSHFSMIERGALEPLLDHLYVQETPYIESLARAAIIAKANSKAEKAAVRYVLDQCFELMVDGRYFQKRAALEIPKALVKITTAQQNGRLGGRRAAQPSGLPTGVTDRLPSGLPSQSQSQMIGSLQLVANNVCVDTSNTHMPEEYKKAITDKRPDLDAELVFRNFQKYYVGRRLDFDKWCQWFAREFPPLKSNHSEDAEPVNPRKAIEARAMAAGIEKWQAIDKYEHWPTYVERVEVAEKMMKVG